MRITLICPVCKKSFTRKPSDIKTSRQRGSKRFYCSQACMGKDRIESGRKLGLSNTWSKGRRFKGRPGFGITSAGHKIIYVPEHPFATGRGYVMEHRLIMEKYLGRYLKPSEKVHHINKNRLDNRIENLELYENQQEHIANHRGKLGKFSV